MAITYKELSLVAELQYKKLPEPLKAKASEFFDALDLDGDGVITLPELLNSNLREKFGEDFVQHVFYSLDEEGKGHLNFNECLTVYYLCMYSSRICEVCERNISHGLGYTCFKCWKEGAYSINGQAFSLCLNCYSSQNYQHVHNPLHLLHDFVLFDNLLNKRPSAPAPIESMPAPVREVEQTVKQCIVCGDHHESTARGFTCDVHMARMRDSIEFVCEWCFSYLCSKCGNLFRDSTTRAEPGKWLQRFVCPSCHKKNITNDCYDASLQRLQRLLAGVELLRHCRTCEIKQRNGTLFWIVNGTNTASSLSAASRAPSASLNARPRNSAYDNQPQVNAANYGGGFASNGSSHHGGRPGGNIPSGGNGISNQTNLQVDNSSGSYRGRADVPSHGGSGHGMVSNRGSSVYPGRGGGGFADRGPNQGKDGSSSSSDESNGGRARFNRPGMLDSAVAAMRGVNRMMNAANNVATLFSGGDGGDDQDGGTGGGAEGLYEVVGSVLDSMNIEE